MIVTVDAGNTRVKVGLAGPVRVTALLDMPTIAVEKDPRFFARALEAMAPPLRGAEGSAVCSVVPRIDRVLSSAVRRVTGKPPFVLRSGSRFPLEVGVADVASVGMDRLAAAAGALGDRRRDAIVVDVGSAVTVDLVLGGTFRGGLIMAGPALGLRALGDYARRLPRIELDRIPWGRHPRFDDTGPSMILGARTASVGAILEGVRLLRRASGERPSVFLTGGGASIVSKGLPTSWRRDPHLVAKGLYRIWSLNMGGTRPRAKKKA